MRSRKGKKECEVHLEVYCPCCGADNYFFVVFDQGYECCPAEPDVGISQPYIELDEPENIDAYEDCGGGTAIPEARWSALVKPTFYKYYESPQGRRAIEQQITDSFEEED